MSLQKQNWDYLIEPDGNYPYVEPGGGTKGSKGNAGTDGTKGNKGQKGITGTLGTDGDKGQKGRAGINGNKGQKGTKGSAATLLTFEGQVPTPADLPLTGNTEGDVYQAVSNNALYVWDGNIWLELAAEPASVKGQKGDDGLKGSKGQKGVEVKGQKGQAGTNAVDGTKGDKGQKGATPDDSEFVTQTEANANFVKYNSGGNSSSQTVSGRLILEQPNNVTTLSVQRSPSSTQATASLVVAGGIAGSIGGTQDLLKSYNYALKADGTAQTQSDYIRYFGRTDTNNSLQTKESCDNRYARLTVANTFTAANTFTVGAIFSGGLTASSTSKFYNSAGSGGEAIQITQMNGSTETGTWRSNGNIEVNELEAASTATLNGNVDVAATKTLTIGRGTNNTTGGLIISGRDTTGTDATLLSCFFNSGGIADAINYFGSTTNTSNIQTQASLQAYVQGGGYTIGNSTGQSGITISGKQGSGALTLSSTNAAGDNGCLKFGDDNSGLSTGQNSYILFQGKGTSTAGSYIFAGDTSVGNVADSRTFFKLVCPKKNSNAAGQFKTQFVGKVTGPTPVDANDLATKGYVDSPSSSWVTIPLIINATSSSYAKYKLFGDMVFFQMFIQSTSGATGNFSNGARICDIPTSVMPPHNLTILAAPATSATNSYGTFGFFFARGTSEASEIGQLYLRCNDKMGSPSQTNTINSNVSGSGQGSYQYSINTAWAL